MKDKTKSIIEIACIVAFTVMCAAAAVVTGVNPADIATNTKRESYLDTVNAIINSDMFNSTKEELIEILPKDLDDGTYKSIILIVNSDMFDSTKEDTIRKIIKK